MALRRAWVYVLVALCAVFLSYLQRNFIERKPVDAAPGSGRFFDDLAGRYDVLNRVISLGFDRSWRTHAVTKLLPAEYVLDVSTGTGDVVRALLAHDTPPRRVVGVDPSHEMLRLARRKFAQTAADVEFVPGVAEQLPFDDGLFDAVIVSFGVRNFAQRDRGLSELARVIRPGGTLVILEVSMTHNKSFLSRVKNVFVTAVMPRAASLLSGHPFAYRYLSDSMHQFPDVPEFSRMLRNAGFGTVSHERLAPFGMGPDLYSCTKQTAGSEKR